MGKWNVSEMYLKRRYPKSFKFLSKYFPLKLNSNFWKFLLSPNSQRNLNWGQHGSRYWSAVQYKQLDKCTQCTHCCSAQNFYEGPRLLFDFLCLFYIHFLILRLFNMNIESIMREKNCVLLEIASFLGLCKARQG